MRRRLVLVGPVFAATLLLAGCDDALDGTGYGEGEPADITNPEAPGQEPAETVNPAVDAEGDPCDGIYGDC